MSEHMLLCETEDDRKAGLLAIEILASPSIKILPEFAAAKEANEVYQLEMMNLLAQITKDHLRSEENAHHSIELALEYALITHEVQNQPYSAGIRCFVMLRAIGESQASMIDCLLDTANYFESLLRTESYFYQRVKPDDIPLALGKTERTAAVALVKEDRIHSLQSPSMAACFSFDRIATTDYSRRRLFSELTQYPNSYVSFQLIPAQYHQRERDLVTGYSQLLNNMVRGVSDQAIPTSISYSAARPEAETYSYYADRAFDGLYRFVIYVEGGRTSAKNIARTIMQEYAGNADIRTSLKTLQIDPLAVACKENPCTLPWIISEIATQSNKTHATQQGQMNFSGFFRFPHLITAEEAATLFHLPIGDETVGAGLVITESAQFNKAYNPGTINAGDISIGTIRSSARKDYIGMTLQDLTKHMLVTGMPGSGKSSFLVGLLDRLWKDHAIPFLVIEPAKNEYRALIKNIPDLQIFARSDGLCSIQLLAKRTVY